MVALRVIERDCLALRLNSEPVSIWAGISRFVPDLVYGCDIIAKSSGAVLEGLAGGTDLDGGAVAVAHDEAAEGSLVVVFDTGDG